MGVEQGGQLLQPEVLLTATEGELTVPFDPRGLRPLYISGVLAVVVGIAMLFDTYVFLGQEVAPPARVAMGLAAVSLGAYLGLSALRRAGTEEPALQLRGDTVSLHVNPGRRIKLSRSEITGVGEVRAVNQRAQQAFLGKSAFEIRTTRPEGLRASTVLVGSKFVAGDLRVCRENLVRALRG